jgi:aspartyl-tRNA(Asn)/glutamyl-tRNA(Gln) amidotransferase subunit A
MRDLHRQTAVGLAAEMRAGRLDPVELAEALLERIARLDGDHAIFLDTMKARALEEAGRARARLRDGRPASPLDGVPIGWKDIFDVRGARTTWGLGMFADRIATADAPLVQRVSEAGLVALGKTNVPEFCFSGLGLNQHFGTPANPFDKEVKRAPGGSSAGSAVAVARGLVPLAVGTDTGGSVRIPAAWNGLTGLKATAGALPIESVMVLAPSFDSFGPMARTVDDAAAFYAVMAGAPPPASEPVRLDRLRLGVVSTLVWDNMDATVEGAVERALAAIEIVSGPIPRIPMPPIERLTTLLAELGNPITVEAYLHWRPFVEANRSQIDPRVLARFQDGERMVGGWERLRKELHGASTQWLASLETYDALLAPTVRISPPPLESLRDGQGYAAANLSAIQNTRAVNLLGGCALTLPCGLDGQGLPVGLTLIGRAKGEFPLLAVGKAVETALAKLPLPTLPCD